jgi:hypothetical protein
VTGASGASVDSSDVQSGVLTLKVNAPAQRSHQFLVSMEKTIGVTKAEVPFLSVKNSQRETGEVLVEGVGTMELTAKEGGSLKRMDVKETNPYLRSLARFVITASRRKIQFWHLNGRDFQTAACSPQSPSGLSSRRSSLRREDR